MEIVWIEDGILAASPCPINRDDVTSIHAQGIRAIVSLTEYALTDYLTITPALLKELNIRYYHAPVRDFSAPTANRVREVLFFIEQMKSEGRPVLIHCLAGQGRTGTMLHAYFLGQGMSLDAAKTQVEAIKPTSHFGLLSQPQQTFLADFAQELDDNNNSILSER